MADDEFTIRPGRVGDRGGQGYRRATSLVGRVQQIARKGGNARHGARQRPRRTTTRRARGGRAALGSRQARYSRRVIVKARIVRHRGTRFRSAPLARHIAYLERDGVTRDGSDGIMFDARGDAANTTRFAGRCESDRHHFRFMVSPEDAAELADIRTFTRELMADMARDCGTALDWVAIDHWNTASPHVHILVRGVADDGSDLVIDRSYITRGLRGRAQERVTLELGPRSERDIDAALRREIGAERWTGLDQQLRRIAGPEGLIDLRPDAAASSQRDRTFLIARAKMLERMGLAEPAGPATWHLSPRAEATLRELGERGDIIRTMHRAMAAQDRELAPDRLVLGAPQPDAVGGGAIEGRLIARGLHDELTGEAFAIVDATDGRTHYLRFPDIERTGDAAPGAIVALGRWTDRNGRAQEGLLVRSDLSLDQQIGARGATWLDRRMMAPTQTAPARGFGAELDAAIGQRRDWLVEQGLATRQGQRVVFSRNLLDRLRADEIAQATTAIAGRYGIEPRPATEGGIVSGVYRERIALASGRYAVIEDGRGFQLVPWRQDLDRHLGAAVSGRINGRGGVDWSLGRKRGPAL
ncbi:relaxase/mobilization nuclease domain-containing protein [Erythrobacter sp. NE805]|uniref:relaxase/mobilization nuclease domain-containing protein n=1 Tax=Erythrobacter sp. NE805 TaxID=3389875 RepID=UPI00396B3A82